MNSFDLLLWLMTSVILAALNLLLFYPKLPLSFRRAGVFCAICSFTGTILSFPWFPVPHLSLGIPAVRVAVPENLLSYFVPVWLTGAILLLCYQGIGVLTVRRIIKRAKAVPESLAERIRLCGFQGETLFSDAAFAPAICGLFRVKMLVPFSALEWSEERWQAVIQHEIAHQKSLDLWTQAAGRLACSLAWLNPLIWVVFQRFCAECEYRCDRLAVSSGLRPESYVKALLDLCSQQNQPSPVLAMARPRGLESRALRLMKPEQEIAPSRFLIVCFLLLAVLLLFHKSRNEWTPEEVRARFAANPFPGNS